MIVDDSTREAVQRLFPLLPWALGQIQHGIDASIFADLEPATRAAVAHDLVLKEGQRRFSDPDDISVSQSQGLWFFVLPDKLLRVKRGDARSLQIANNNTVQTMIWTYQLPLEGLPDPRERLHLVYVPDQFWLRIERCVVGQYHGKTPISWFEVDVDDWYERGGAVINPFTPEPEMPSLRLKPGVVPLPLEEIDGAS